MSIILKDKIIVKGSPEMLEELCKSVPSDFKQVLDSLTNQGYRVIAFGQKPIEDADQDREVLEKDLEFLGLLVMINNLKEVSAATIQELNDCEIRTVMATGDNLLTAASVAKKCNILQNTDLMYLGDIFTDQSGKKTIEWKKVSKDGDLQIEFNENKSKLQKYVPWVNEKEEFGVAVTGKVIEYIKTKKKLVKYVLPVIL